MIIHFYNQVSKICDLFINYLLLQKLEKVKNEQIFIAQNIIVIILYDIGIKLITRIFANILELRFQIKIFQIFDNQLSKQCIKILNFEISRLKI